MKASSRFTPRALLHRSTVPVNLTPSQLFNVIRLHEEEAEQAIADGLDDYADFLLHRVAILREAGR